MHLYTIGDLHLSFGVPDKPMDIFHGWKNYQAILKKSWEERIQLEDVVVLAGDFSWGMTLEQAHLDFAFVQALPGKKILLKGNHDYWWASKTKMENYFVTNGFDTLHILHNNHYAFEQFGICGTRGWVSMNGELADERVLAREVQRLRVSIQSALQSNLKPIVFLHYPPIYGGFANESILDTLQEFEIEQCYFGHVHGRGHASAYQGIYHGTDLRLISSDYLHFIPKKVM